MRLLALIVAVSLWSIPEASAQFDGGVISDGNGLVVAPTTLYLGSTGPGQALNNSFTITNTETLLTLTVTGVYKPAAQCGFFTLTPPGNLPRAMTPSQVDSWTVSFSASSPGSYYCHAEFQDNDGNVDFIDLQASVASPMMSTSPPSLDFGPVMAGDTDTRAFYITNNGSGTLTVSSLSQIGTSEFQIAAPATPFTIAPFGGVATIYVSYTPANAGSDTGSVTISGDDPANLTDVVSFSGSQDTSGGTARYINLSPDPLAFGAIAVGDSNTAAMSVTATGVGTTHVSNFSIVGPGATSFTIESNGCTNTQSCPVSLDLDPIGTDASVAIRCAPASVGPKAAQFIVTSDATNNPVTASLSCSGSGGDISITPPGLGFGTIRLGQVVTLPITVANNGNAQLAYNFVFTGAPDYAATLPCATTCYLGAGTSTQHTIAFSPTEIGPRNGSLVVYSNDPLEMMTSVSLSGTGGGGVLTIAQPLSGQIAFGGIPLDVTSAPQTIQIRNDGNLNLKVSGISLSSMTAFGLTGTVPPPDLILLPNQSHTVNATCTPPDTIAYVGSVTFTTDAPIDPVQAVGLTCTGVDTDLVATPAPVTFAQTRVGDSDVIEVTVRNNGAATQITARTASPGVFTIEDAAALPISLAANATTELDVRFTPTADGDVAGTLTITGGSGDPLAVNLIGPGRVASFTVSPPSYDFGAVCAGTSTVKRFLVTSTGTAEFEIATPLLDDPDVAFDLAMIDPAASEFPAMIAPADLVTVDITAEPTGPSGSGTLRFDTDVQGGDVDVPLQIVAVSSGVGVGPAAVDFGPVAVDAISETSDVSLANCDAVSLAVSSVRIIGEDAAAFAVGGTLPPPDLTVPALGNVRWTVVFRPEREGAHVATLEIVHALGTEEIPLDGLGAVAAPDAGPGIGDPDAGGAGFDTTSYYACWCRGSSGADVFGAVPLVLIIGFGLRRRRR